MQVFKCFFYILNKYKISLFVYFIVFLGLMFIFTSSNEKNEQDTFSTYAARIGIIDEDQSGASKALVHFLEQESANVPIKNDKKEVQDMLFYRDVEYVLYIPENYENILIKGEKPVLKNVKIPNSSTGNFMDIKINRYQNILSTYLTNDLELEQALEKTGETVKQSADVEITSKSGINEATPGYFYFYTYYTYLIVMLLIFGMGVVLIQFNRKDIRNRTLCSALGQTGLKLQLGLGCFAYAFGIWLLMNGVAIALYHSQTRFWGNLPYMALNSFVITCVGVSLAFLSGMLAKTSEGTNGFGNVFGLGLAFLGGVFVPQELMSKSLLKFSQFVPSFWYMKILNLLKVSGVHDSDEWVEFGKGVALQIAFVVAIIGIALIIRKSKSTH